MREAIDRIAPVLLGVLVVAAGGYLYVSEQDATEGAEEVEAVVVSAEVVNDVPQGDVEEDDFHPRIEYRYTYDGESYTSRNICPGAGSACAPSGPDRGEVEDFVDRYPDGEAVTVYVPPSDPEGAYLVEGGSSMLYLGLLGVGLVVIVLGVRKAL